MELNHCVNQTPPWYNLLEREISHSVTEEAEESPEKEKLLRKGGIFEDRAESIIHCYKRQVPANSFPSCNSKPKMLWSWFLIWWPLLIKLFLVEKEWFELRESLRWRKWMDSDCTVALIVETMLPFMMMWFQRLFRWTLFLVSFISYSQHTLLSWSYHMISLDFWKNFSLLSIHSFLMCNFLKGTQLFLILWKWWTLAQNLNFYKSCIFIL